MRHSATTLHPSLHTSHFMASSGSLTREESSPSDPVYTIGMCKPHQRCSDNRSHHAGCVCRAFRRASYILRCVRYLSTNRMFTPHLSTCELHPGCVCVCRIVAGGIP